MGGTRAKTIRSRCNALLATSLPGNSRTFAEANRYKITGLGKSALHLLRAPGFLAALYYLAKAATTMGTAGPRITTNIEGKMRKTMGNIILTGAW